MTIIIIGHLRKLWCICLSIWAALVTFSNRNHIRVTLVYCIVGCTNQKQQKQQNWTKCYRNEIRENQQNSELIPNESSLVVFLIPLLYSLISSIFFFCCLLFRFVYVCVWILKEFFQNQWGIFLLDSLVLFFIRFSLFLSHCLADDVVLDCVRAVWHAVAHHWRIRCRPLPNYIYMHVATILLLFCLFFLPRLLCYSHCVYSYMLSDAVINRVHTCDSSDSKSFVLLSIHIFCIIVCPYSIYIFLLLFDNSYEWVSFCAFCLLWLSWSLPLSIILNFMPFFVFIMHTKCLL